MSNKPHKPLLRDPCLLTLPDDLITKILVTLPLNSAFSLAQVNTRLLQIFRTSYQTVHIATPYNTNPIITTQQLTTILHQTPNLKTLTTSTPLPQLPKLPLRRLSCLDSLVSQPCFPIPTLTQLSIDSPLHDTPRKLSSVIHNLSKLEITNIDAQSPLLHHIQSLLNHHGHNLTHLTLTLEHKSVHRITDFIHVLTTTLPKLANLQTLRCGTDTPHVISRSPHPSHDFIKSLTQILTLLTKRPAVNSCSRSTDVYIFTRLFEPGLLRAVLPYAANSNIKLSFSANTLIIPRHAPLTITELASHPSMYKIPFIHQLHTNIQSFNIVLRELAIAFTNLQIQPLQALLNSNLTTLRVQIPFRSITNLTPIVENIIQAMALSTIQELHITREIVYFLQEPVITTLLLLPQWKTLKRLYLTAPERFTQDPYPERRCAKYSAWRFMISLPKFLQRLSHICPTLEVLLLESICEMGVVQNPTAMTSFIEEALKAVDAFEHVLSVDAGTVRAQLLVWSNQFL